MTGLLEGVIVTKKKIKEHVVVLPDRTFHNLRTSKSTKHGFLWSSET